MQPKSIYVSDSYRTFIRAVMDANAGQRGYQKRLAEAAKCHTSFLSQVLKGSVHLTPDQAAGMAEFWNLTSDETQYFLDLVHLERSSSPSLKRHLKKSMDDLKKKGLSVSNRIGSERALTDEDQLLYYSAWYYSAIHVLVAIPSCRTISALAKTLKLDGDVVSSALAKLQKMNLVQPDIRGDWTRTERSLHLADDSHLTAANHSNWRHKSLLKIQERRSENMHYTAAFSLAEKDYDRLRDLVLGFLTATREVIGPSPEEVGACLTLDLFKI